MCVGYPIIIRAHSDTSCNLNYSAPDLGFTGGLGLFLKADFDSKFNYSAVTEGRPLNCF